jgi:hypothetical protein
MSLREEDFLFLNKMLAQNKSAQYGLFYGRNEESYIELN